MLYRNKLCSNAGNFKQTWKTLNKLTNIKTTNSTIHAVKDEAGEIMDEERIPDTFNRYFVDIGEKLAANIPQSHISPESFLNDVYYPENDLPSFKEISENDVLKQLHGLGDNKASGPDGIPSHILKLATTVISPSQTLIFNLTITTGIFPTDWKIARISPIHKSDTKDRMANYRPISIISIIAKVAEKLIYNQLYNYLHNCIKLLANFQHEFRPLQLHCNRIVAWALPMIGIKTYIFILKNRFFNLLRNSAPMILLKLHMLKE